MRWVWRAEAGGAKVEYGGLVLLVAAVTAAVLSYGIPANVGSLIERGICLIPGDEDCDERVVSSEPEPDGGDTPSTAPEEGSGGDPEPDEEDPTGTAESPVPPRMTNGTSNSRRASPTLRPTSPTLTTNWRMPSPSTTTLRMSCCSYSRS